MNPGEETSPPDRFDVAVPATTGDERTTLMGMLQRQRDLIGWKLRDIDDDLLRSSRTPSGMTPHGLVQHLTAVERSWVRHVFAGQPDVRDRDSEWVVPVGTTATNLLEAYAAESRLCDEVVLAAPSLDAISAHREVSLRWVLLHLVEETARHLGHLDLLREAADGSIGEEPED